MVIGLSCIGQADDPMILPSWQCLADEVLLMTSGHLHSNDSKGMFILNTVDPNTGILSSNCLHMLVHLVIR